MKVNIYKDSIENQLLFVWLDLSGVVCEIFLRKKIRLAPEHGHISSE